MTRTDVRLRPVAARTAQPRHCSPCLVAGAAITGLFLLTTVSPTVGLLALVAARLALLPLAFIAVAGSVACAGCGERAAARQWLAVLTACLTALVAIAAGWAVQLAWLA